MSDGRGPVAAVVLAGGSGTRLGADQNKVYLDLGGRPMLAWSLLTLDQHPDIDRLVVAVRPGDEEAFDEAVPRDLGTPISAVAGGASRSASELAALELLSPAIDSDEIAVVVIHDGARPFIDQPLVDRIIDAARVHGAAIPGLAPSERVFAIAEGQTRARALPSERLRRVQTPQAFWAHPLLDA